MSDVAVENMTSPNASTPKATSPERDLVVEAVASAGSHAWLGRAMTVPLRKLWLDVDMVGRENVPTKAPSSWLPTIWRSLTRCW